MRLIGQSNTTISSRGPHGEHGLGVIFKRVLAFGGSLERPVTIRLEPLVEGDMLVAEADSFGTHRPTTDVLVEGSVFSRIPVPFLDATVAVGSVCATVRVHGERRVRLSSSGVSYEQVGPLHSERLDYRAAYGGAFGGQTARRRGAFGASGRYEPDPAYWSYPRNPVGRGFVIEDRLQSLDGELAPSQEDPADPATPDRLVRTSGDDWQSAPRPGGFGPIHLAWSPRADWLIPVIEGVARRLGAAGPRASLGGESCANADEELVLDPRVLSAATPALGSAALSGTVPISLQGFQWGSGSTRLSVDTTAPRARMHFRGARSFDVETTLKTLSIDTDAEEITMVWCGFQRTAMPYKPEHMDDVRVEFAT